MKHIIPAEYSFNLAIALDLLERVVYALLFGFLAVRMLLAYSETGAVGYLLIMVSETLVFCFILARRTTNKISLRPADWLFAMAGTILPLFIVAGGEPLVPGSITITLMLGGMAINFWAKLSLRRSIGAVAANRGVKTNGPYRLVRHPMYLGYWVTQVGFLLFNPTLWNFAIWTAASTFQVFRILAEERILSVDLNYQKYAATVRYRLIPGVL
jgi:protein-S-isoprenylcysteine O-methyltransferase Ste14